MSLTLRNTPKTINAFFIRGLIIFVVWKLLYVFVLIPLRFPDEQLTRLFLFTTTKILSAFHPGSYFIGEQIFNADKKIIRIGYPCNGLEVMVLYSGFILAMPTIVKCHQRKAIFILCGIAGIVLLNIIRCASLSIIAFQYPQIFDFSHKYAFNIIAYGLMIYAWRLFCKNKKYVA